MAVFFGAPKNQGFSPLVFCILILLRAAGHALDGLVVLDPVLHVHHGVFGGGVANDDLGNAGVDDVPAAHGAGGGVVQQLPRDGVPAAEVEGAADALAAGGGDDGVGLCVDGTA